MSRLAVLLAFIYYLSENIIEEDLLLQKSLERHSTEKKIFNDINSHLIEHEISWEKHVDVCSAASRAKTGKVVGVLARIKEFALFHARSHCVLH